MSNTVIRFGTFNVGAGWLDLEVMAKNDPVQGEALRAFFISCKNAQEEAEIKSNVQRTIETKVANYLAENLDVISLQEMKSLDRPFMQKLSERGFQIFHLPVSQHIEKFYDCAIAVKSDIIFGAVENISISSTSHPDNKRLYGQEIAAIAFKANNGARLVFSSLHSWGFQLYPKEHTEKGYTERDQSQMSYALSYAREAVNAVKSRSADGIFIGGDMNNNQDNYTAAFEVFTKAGYQVLEPKEATNVNVYESAINYSARTIDCLFSSTQSWLAPAWNLFYSSYEITTTEARVLDGVQFTVATNCSDHRPVAIDITIAPKPSKLSQLWQWLWSFIR